MSKKTHSDLMLDIVKETKKSMAALDKISQNQKRIARETSKLKDLRRIIETKMNTYLKKHPKPSKNKDKGK